MVSKAQAQPQSQLIIATSSMGRDRLRMAMVNGHRHSNILVAAVEACHHLGAACLPEDEEAIPVHKTAVPVPGPGQGRMVLSAHRLQMVVACPLRVDEVGLDPDPDSTVLWEDRCPLTLLHRVAGHLEVAVGLVGLADLLGEEAGVVVAVQIVCPLIQPQ